MGGGWVDMRVRVGLSVASKNCQIRCVGVSIAAGRECRVAGRVIGGHSAVYSAATEDIAEEKPRQLYI